MAIAGTFDPDRWTAAEKKAYALTYDEVLAALAQHPAYYAATLNATPDEAMREHVDLFAIKGSRGSFIVNQVLCGHAAYRTQLFVYLKACGRSELNTMDLWGGMDS